MVFLMLEFVGLGMSGTFVEESRCRDWWDILNGSGGPAFSLGLGFLFFMLAD